MKTVSIFNLETEFRDRKNLHQIEINLETEVNIRSLLETKTIFGLKFLDTKWYSGFNWRPSTKFRSQFETEVVFGLRIRDQILCLFPLETKKVFGLHFFQETSREVSFGDQNPRSLINSETEVDFGLRFRDHIEGQFPLETKRVFWSQFWFHLETKIPGL